MITVSRLFLLSCLLLFPLTDFGQSPQSFAQAKKLANRVFARHPQTLYCHCRYDANHRIDLSSCGMAEAAVQKRATRMEWENMMPAENFGRHFQCWREALCQTPTGKRYKGRRCCEKIDARFRHLEAELFNLWPAVGLVNQARSNYRYAQLPNKQPFYGCKFAVDKDSRRVEPPDVAKGVVARANLFVAEHYHIALSPSQRQLFMAWSQQFPATAWEKEWASQVSAIEGYGNPYIG